jgi:protoporphyrinogen oxidase
LGRRRENQDYPLWRPICGSWGSNHQQWRTLYDLKRVFPQAARELLEIRIFRYPQGISYFPPGHAPILPDLQRPQGNLFFCGDYLYGAGVWEAVVSGNQAASQVLKHLN